SQPGETFVQPHHGLNVWSVHSIDVSLPMSAIVDLSREVHDEEPVGRPTRATGRDEKRREAPRSDMHGDVRPMWSFRDDLTRWEAPDGDVQPVTDREQSRTGMSVCLAAWVTPARDLRRAEPRRAPSRRRG